MQPRCQQDRGLTRTTSARSRRSWRLGCAWALRGAFTCRYFMHDDVDKDWYLYASCDGEGWSDDYTVYKIADAEMADGLPVPGAAACPGSGSSLLDASPRGSGLRGGGLSVLSFIRVRTWLALDAQAPDEQLIADVAALADCEGLAAHAASARQRLGRPVTRLRSE